MAVSGGADSVCLLHMMVECFPALELSVLHLNHLTRGEESDADAAFVRDLAARLGLPFVYREQRIPAGENFEQAARRARQAFFLECLETLDRVATGHTRSDQAETVLFRFLRGSGTAGLCGILPVTAEGIVRPLLHLTREQVERWLRDRGLTWREDVSNRDLKFARNRIRHELLPALTRDWNPGLTDALARTAAIAQEEEAYWAEIIAPLAAERIRLRPPAVLFRADALTSLPRAVARRLARRAVEMAKGDLRAVGLQHVGALLELAGSAAGAGGFQAPGVDIRRSFDWIRIVPTGAEVRPGGYRLPLVVPGKVEIPGTGAALELELIEPKGQEEAESGPKCRYNENVSALDWERISGRPEVRNWRPGDRYRPAGRRCEIKLKVLFQETRIPVWHRRKWPVITSGEEIVWAGRFGPAERFRPTPETRKILKVRELGSLTEF